MVSRNNELPSNNKLPSVDADTKSVAKPADKTSAPKSPDLIAEATTMLRNLNSDNQTCARQDRERYIEILLRAATPEPGDAEQLVDLAGLLGLEVESIAADAEVIRKASRLQKLRAQLPEFRVKVAETSAALRKLKKKQEEEIEAAERVVAGAQSHVNMAVHSNSTLRQLAQQHPDLFEAGDDAQSEPNLLVNLSPVETK